MRFLSKDEYPNLPDYSALVVDGDGVLPEQAAEILIRTNKTITVFNVLNKDQEWFIACNRILGTFLVNNTDAKSVSMSEFTELVKTHVQDVKRINLKFLANEQIGSEYNHGPYGWCNWNGEIGCCHGNVGKHPSVQAVETEWKKLAREFPFLDLKAQLFNKPQEDDTKIPLVEFWVYDGKVRVVRPESVLKTNKFGAKFKDNIKNHENEYGYLRGCTLEQLKVAVDLVKKK